MTFAYISWLDWLTIVLCLYIIFECFTAVCSMGAGWRLFCHKLKFGLGFSTGLALIYYAVQAHSQEFEWLICGMAGTLAAFVWPRMVWRLTNAMQQLEICLNETHD